MSLPNREVRDLPAPPRNYWRLVGPGIVAAGVALSSGEFVLWPLIATQVGLILLWGALTGVVTQFFINMEVERYTLATGETALTGFNRFWRHWGIVFALFVYLGNLWPGWVLSSATLSTFLFGGNPTTIAIILLLVIGAALTLAPVIYIALERLMFVKVAAVVTLIVLAFAFAIEETTWRQLPAGFLGIGTIPPGLDIAIVFGAVAYAGSGGGTNLCQSNWIRDKGFAMGQYIPRLVSPITGREEAAGTMTSFMFEPTNQNMSRWRSWWRFANVEQLFSFVLVTMTTIGLTSMLAHSTLFGVPGLTNDMSFLRLEAQALEGSVGRWFAVLFLAIGAFSLFGSAMGTIDYTCRLTADVLKSTYMPRARISESRLYFWLVWVIVALGCGIMLSGAAQPLTLLVISACTAGTMMFVYSMLLIALNRSKLPAVIRINGSRVAALVWATILYGSLAAVTIYKQIPVLFR
jgi:hypothetical protein